MGPLSADIPISQYRTSPLPHSRIHESRDIARPLSIPTLAHTRTRARALALPPTVPFLSQRNTTQHRTAQHSIAHIHAQYATHPTYRNSPPPLLVSHRYHHHYHYPNLADLRSAHTRLSSFSLRRYFSPLLPFYLSLFLPVAILQLLALSLSRSLKGALLFNTTRAHTQNHSSAHPHPIFSAVGLLTAFQGFFFWFFFSLLSFPPSWPHTSRVILSSFSSRSCIRIGILRPRIALSAFAFACSAVLGLMGTSIDLLDFGWRASRPRERAWQVSLSSSIFSHAHTSFFF